MIEVPILVTFSAVGTLVADVLGWAVVHSGTGYAADGKLASRDYANPLFPLRRAYGYEPDTQRLSRMQTWAKKLLGDGMEAKQDDSYRWDPAGNNTAITDNTQPSPVSTTSALVQVQPGSGPQVGWRPQPIGFPNLSLGQMSSRTPIGRGLDRRWSMHAGAG